MQGKVKRQARHMGGGGRWQEGKTVMDAHHANWTWYSLASMPHHPMCYQNCLAPVDHSSLVVTAYDAQQMVLSDRLHCLCMLCCLMTPPHFEPVCIACYALRRSSQRAIHECGVSIPCYTQCSVECRIDCKSLYKICNIVPPQKV